MSKTKWIMACSWALFLCGSALGQSGDRLVLRGTVVTPVQVIEDGYVSIAGGKITEAGAFHGQFENDAVVETNSFIVPGLIDLHNHITWNLLPRWSQHPLFDSRYQWQQQADYAMALSTPHRKLVDDGFACDANLYGEVKAIVGGATSVAGSLAPSKPGSDDNRCIVGLARNLDFYSGLFAANVLNQEPLRYEVFPLTIPLEAAAKIRSDLEAGTLRAYVVHLAEGRNSDLLSRREFTIFENEGFIRPGVTIIHGVALDRQEFEKMAKAKVGLVWSPRSNIELYGSTTNVAAAKQAGVTIALSPDWSPSGSDGMLAELKYAATWNAGQIPAVFDEAELLKMATIYPAQLAGLSDSIGSIRPGFRADLLLIARSRHKDPFRALAHTNPEDVRLVMVDGTAVYGDDDLMKRLHRRQPVLPLAVCGRQKALFIEPESRALSSWREFTQALNAELHDWGVSLSGLAACAPEP